MDFCKENHIKKMSLFGSALGNNFQSDKSDIDILIDTKVKDARNRFYLKEYLSQNLNRDVDICYSDGLRSFIKKNIQSELVYV